MLLRHPYLGIEPEVVLETVAQPDARMPGHRPGEEWFYRRGVEPVDPGGRTLRRRPRPHRHRVPPVEIGDIEHDDVFYDREVDVLYLWAGKPRHPAHDDASPEGHYLQFDEDGSLIAITIVNARWLLERDSKIVVTLPDGRKLETSDLGEALAAA